MLTPRHSPLYLGSSMVLQLSVFDMNLIIHQHTFRFKVKTISNKMKYSHTGLGNAVPNH